VFESLIGDIELWVTRRARRGMFCILSMLEGTVLASREIDSNKSTGTMLGGAIKDDMSGNVKLKDYDERSTCFISGLPLRHKFSLEIVAKS
jgi:hypothetical protein